jgi:hypothetical protein
MSREVEAIATALFDKIRTRFDNVRLGDEKSKATTDPEKARFINFDYAVDGEKVGNITVSLIDENSLKVYYGQDIVDRLKEIGENQDSEVDKAESAEDKWYGFLRGIRKFAKRNLLSFDTRDIAKKNLEVKDVKQQTRADSTLDAEDIAVNESRMHGTSRSSYQECGPVRIIVRHSDNVDEEKRGARTRNVESVFVETHLGERFLLPFKNLHGARAMAQHCSQGGRVEDELGLDIANMVTEMEAMKHFVRGAQRRQFEDTDTSEMAHAAINRYNQLKHQLRHIGGRRGYGDYKLESRTPDATDDEIDLQELRDRFAKRVYNDRFDEALPYVYRAYMKHKQQQDTPMSEEFESWANEVTEGAWALPDQDHEVQELDQLMAQRFPVGIGAENATALLYEIIGDDGLVDKLQAFASSQGDAADEADCRGVVIEWLRDNGYTELADKYNQLYTQNTQPLQAQAQQNQADAAQQQAQAQGQGVVGAPGTGPSVASAQAESADPLDFIRFLSGIKK